MKSTAELPAALQTHYNGGQLTTANLLRIARLDDVVFGFTSHDQSITLDTVLYDAAQGLDVTDIATSAGAAVDNLELLTLHDGSLFTEADILNGVWDNAAFLISRYNHATPANGLEYMIAGLIGQVTLRQNSVRAELRGLQQLLQQSVGRYVGINCSFRLGVNDGIFSRCPVAIGPLTLTGTLDDVTSNQVFQDSSRTEDTDYYGDGVFTFTSGANAGVARRIKTYTDDGTFTLDRPMYHAVTGTETYTVKPGCRKRYIPDCVQKFDVGRSFGGFAHLPGRAALIAPVPNA